ncbi:MAG: PEGA domain-containing protein, partial [Myxococcota bacterium]|nr:PEGA domain-containing protein [Myxococcota bacterium]
DVELSPGPHTIKLTEPGRMATEKQIDVSFASTQGVMADLDPEPPPPTPPPQETTVPLPASLPASPPPPQPRSKVPAFVTGGLAVAAAGVGTVFGVLALNDKRDFDANPTTTTADNGDTHALIADMAFGVALTFGVTSAVLFLTKDEPATPPVTAAATKVKNTKAEGVAVTPVPWVGPRSGGAGFLVRF